MKKSLIIIIILILVVSGCSNEEEDTNETNNTETPINTTPSNSTNTTINETETNTTTTQEASCKDSDDGKDYETWGYIKINGTKEYLDDCISDLRLREYYCNEEYPGNLAFEIYSCYDTCEDGECTVINTTETNLTNTT